MEKNNLKIDIKNFAKIYGEFFEKITKDNIENLNSLCSKDIFFKDPFNSFTGIEKFKKVFLHMYEQSSNPRFSIIDICVNDNLAFIKWNFFSGNFIKIEGISEIKFNSEGLVLSHIDYWDSSSQIFAKIPIIKYLIKFMIKKFSI